MTVSGPMSCREFSARAGAYLDGALVGPDLERFEAHRDRCGSCRAGLAELQAIAGAARRLRLPAGAGDSRAVQLFRDLGLHAPRPRIANLPLGIGNQTAARGDHIAFLWDSEAEFAATADFLATGFARGEAGVLVGHEPGNTRILAALTSRGANVAELTRSGLLVVESRRGTAEALLAAVDGRIKAAVDRGLSGVRVLGNLSFGSPDVETLRLEALVTDAVRLHPNVVLCAFDAARVTSGALGRDAFQCHPMVLQRGELRESEAYVPAPEFLADLDRGT